MKNIFIGLFVVSLAILSCQKKDEKPTYIAEEKSETTAPTTDQTNVAGSNAENAVQINGNPQSNQTIQIDPNAVSPAKKTPTAPGMNPPHGEPGHRCDIPVGQPLNSKPASAANTAPTVANNPVTIAPPVSAPAAQPVATGPRPVTNPEHGQPHHRCDLKVGEPLP